MKRADFGKIRTKDRNSHVRDFGKIGLKIGGVSRSIFSLVKITNLPQLLMPFINEASAQCSMKHPSFANGSPYNDHHVHDNILHTCVI